MPQPSAGTGRCARQAQARGTPPRRPQRPLRLAARVGLVAYGLVHLVLAGLIAQVALGRARARRQEGRAGGDRRDGGRPGAAVGGGRRAGGPGGHAARRGRAPRCGRRADRPGGASAGWRSTSARPSSSPCSPTRPRRSPRPRAATRSASRWSAKLFDLPGGPFLVGLVGVAIVAAGVYAVRARGAAVVPRRPRAAGPPAPAGHRARRGRLDGARGRRRARRGRCSSPPRCSSTRRRRSGSTPGSGRWPTSRSGRPCCWCWPPAWPCSPCSACSTRGTEA